MSMIWCVRSARIREVVEANCDSGAGANDDDDLVCGRVAVYTLRVLWFGYSPDIFCCIVCGGLPGFSTVEIINSAGKVEGNK